MRDISYDEFGELRFLDFFPRTSAYEEDAVGGIEYAIGYGGKEGYTLTLFVRVLKETNFTGEIRLDFNEDCPETLGHALLDSLGSKVRKGMTSAELKALLGNPERERPRFVRFITGVKQSYYVGCGLDNDMRLYSCWIARKDLVDRNEAMI